MAFFAINIASVQNANAQVNKQREQFLQATQEGNKPEDQGKPEESPKLNATATEVQASPSKVNKQREQMLQTAKGFSTTDDPIKVEDQENVELRNAHNNQGSVAKIKHVTNAGKNPVEADLKVQKKVKAIKESMPQGPLAPEQMKVVDRYDRAGEKAQMDRTERRSRIKKVDQDEQVEKTEQIIEETKDLVKPEK